MPRPVHERLTEMGDWREIAQSTLERISADMPELVREAYAAGHTKAQIVRMAKISRPTLDAMLKQQ